MGKVRLSQRGDGAAGRSGARAKVAMGIAGCLMGAAVLAATSYMGGDDAALAAGGDARELQAVETCSRFNPSRDGKFYIQGKALCDDAQGWIPLAMFLMLYMFWALAIVVDENFVPVLDFIVLELQIDEDVAGATFMAAGGSAPEFFTNMISVIEITGTGFGTIVGSAIFNILFVISMSAFFSRDRDEVVRRRELADRGTPVKEPWPHSPLPLTWWPLLRDATVYVLGLSVLAIFYFCLSDGLLPGGVCGVEDGGLILWYEALILFLMYVGYCVLMGFQTPVKRFVETHMTFLIPRDQRAGGARHEGTLALKVLADGQAGGKDATGRVEPVVALPRASDADSVPSTASQSGRNPRLKLKQQASTAFIGHGTDAHDGRGRKPSIGFPLSRRGLLVNDDLGRSPSGVREGSSSHLSLSGAGAGEDGADGDDDEVTVVVPRMRPTSFAGDPERKDDVRYRVMNAALYMLVLPILVSNVFIFFNFDSLVKIEGKLQKRAAGTYAFFMSLVWIALFTWIMVYSAETMGATWGIPDTILGFTILAAGTSVPDLLSSVFVAQLGYGDMAVSSSIGSNIFDILVGLPVPWLVAILANGRPLPVSTGAVGYSLAVIILMVVSLVAIIIWQDWKLTKRAAFAMLVLYFVFLVAVIAFDLA